MMLNRINPFGDEARLAYGDAEYTVLRNGRYVRCAVTNEPIPLEDLRYWSVDLQEAYRGPEEALARWRRVRGAA